MKFLAGLFLFCSSLFAASPFPTTHDFIHDDYTESNGVSVHSRGLLSYGTNSNTFHVRRFFLRGNYQIKDLQVFATLNGYHDTHDPDTNYGYILNNINLYDYGLTYQLPLNLFVSLRGAATYRENYDTLLLFMPYFYPGNPGDFEAPVQYIPIHPTGPGIRVGFENEHFLIGYSQGDFRHVIPTAIVAKARFGRTYVRLSYLSEYLNPSVFDRNSQRRKIQLGAGSSTELGSGFNGGVLAEATYREDSTWWFRAEAAIEYQTFVLAARQILMTRQEGLFEMSFSKRIENVASLGIQVSFPDVFYVAAEVNF